MSLSVSRGKTLLTLQAVRPPDLDRAVAPHPIPIPMPDIVREQVEAWEAGTRGPVLPTEAVGLLWSTPVAGRLAGGDVLAEVPVAGLLLPVLVALRAIDAASWPQRRSDLRKLVATGIPGLAADDFMNRLVRLEADRQLADLVLLLKYAATGSIRPLGQVVDLFRLVTALMGEEEAEFASEDLTGWMSAALLVPRHFVAPVLRRGPGAPQQPVNPGRGGRTRSVDLSSPRAVAAVRALEAQLERLREAPTTAVRTALVRAQPAGTYATVRLGGVPVVFDTTQVRERLRESRRELVDQVRSGLPTTVRDRLDDRSIAVDELRSWPVLCAPGPAPAPAPSYLEPAGRTDLLLVRQRTTGYRRAEVAHIENVMVGETRNRDHTTRVSSTTETFVGTVAESETTNDLETASRAELTHEVSQIVAEDLRAEGSVTVSSRGPTKVVASAGGAYSRATQDAASTAASYARETIERAVTRTLDRTTRERRTVSVREQIEANHHGFVRDPDAEQHAVGVYQYLERVSRARLFWYGEREMYDVLVPEPAALIWQIAADQPEPREPPRPPDAELFGSITVATVETQLEAAMRSFRVVDLPPRPPETDVIAWGTRATGSGDKAKHAAQGELRIPPGYEVVSADFSVTVDVDSEIQPNGFVSIAGKNHAWTMDTSGPNHVEMTGTIDLVDPAADAHPLAGASVSVGFTADNYAVVVLTLTLNLRLTEAARHRWRVDVYERVAARYDQLRLDYEDAVSQAELLAPSTQDQLPVGTRARLASIVRHELQRAVVSLMRNDPVDYDLIAHTPVAGAAPDAHPTPDTDALVISGPQVRFLQQAFEWEHLSWILYPYFWGRRSGWSQTAVVDHPDPDFAAFLNAGAARVQVPVRPGFEQLVKHFMETGEVYPAMGLPHMGDEGYLPFIDEQLTSLGAPTDEPPWPPDAPLEWDVVDPTPLIMLRPAGAPLPAWDPVTGVETEPGDPA